MNYLQKLQELEQCPICGGKLTHHIHSNDIVCMNNGKMLEFYCSYSVRLGAFNLSIETNDLFIRFDQNTSVSGIYVRDWYNYIDYTPIYNVHIDSLFDGNFKKKIQYILLLV